MAPCKVRIDSDTTHQGICKGFLPKNKITVSLHKADIKVSYDVMAFYNITQVCVSHQVDLKQQKNDGDE